MNNSSEERLKIAVFIDFDNIAIGVKQSMNRNFEVGTVLEAIKEKGQVISKIAYGDWKRAEDFSRAMTQHAVQMVQRNLTPGGDKNGADIALALDALEMAFTRDHINAFVIVGGDSDFIALVEKLKQYDKTVFVVGGRAFTSVILQKNCHEFISYENLIGIQTGVRRSVGRSQMSSSTALENALPLIRRALKVLSDREVSPQLGLLKSTLLQLDSTFSERDYGVGSFRDFIQKLANAGFVNLKQVDRSLLVELKETPEESVKEIQEPPVPDSVPTQDVVEPPPAAMQPQDAIRVIQDLLRDSKVTPHWPMYLRTFKQFLRSLQPSFDERQFGISSTYDLVRLAHREGLIRVERNRQGILRIFPAERFPRTTREEPESSGDRTAAESAEVAEAVESEAKLPIMESEVPAQEPESALQPEVTVELIESSRDTGQSEPALETSSSMQSEHLDAAPEAKQKAKRGRRISPIRTAKSGKGEIRRSRQPKENSKRRRETGNSTGTIQSE
jgi:uncharacterized LabA/DUF88 family protein